MTLRRLRHCTLKQRTEGPHLGGMVGGGTEDGLEHGARLDGGAQRRPPPRIGCAAAARLVLCARRAQPRHDVPDLRTARTTEFMATESNGQVVFCARLAQQRHDVADLYKV